MPLIPVRTTVRDITEILGGRARHAAPGSKQTRPCDAATPTVAEILGIDGPRVEPLLRRRRATRVFSPETPAPDRVRKIVESAYAVDRRQWHCDEDPALSILLGIGNPTVLPALREVYSDAPVLLFICGDVRSAAEADSGTGYGSLLVRAGALGYALWLAAVAEGLAGCVYGRPSASVTAAAREIGPGTRHLFTVALGADGSHDGGEQVKHEA